MTETAREVAEALDLWRATDLALVEHRVALERTRKASTLAEPTHVLVVLVMCDGCNDVAPSVHAGASEGSWRGAQQLT